MQRKLYFSAVDECEDRMDRDEGNDCYLEELMLRQEELKLTRDQVAYVWHRTNGIHGCLTLFR